MGHPKHDAKAAAPKASMGSQFDKEDPFPHFAANPKSTYHSHLAVRGVAAVLSLVSLLFVALSFGLPLAKMTLNKAAYKGVHFDIYLWSLGTGDSGNTAYDVYFDEQRHAWVNGGMRVASILALLFSVATSALSIALCACRCESERARRADDVEREHALHEDHREQAYFLARANEGASDHGGADGDCSDLPPLSKKRVDATALVSVDSHMKPAWYYAQRENARRTSDFNVAVSFVVFAVLTIVVLIVSMIYGGVYLKGSSFAKDLAGLFEQLFIRLTADELAADPEAGGARTAFQAGFWLQLGAILAMLIALLLDAVPCLSGTDLASGGKDTYTPTPIFNQTSRHNRDGADPSDSRLPFGEDDIITDDVCDKACAASTPAASRNATDSKE